MKRYDVNVIWKVLVTLVSQKLPRYVDARPQDIQILTPMRKGALGVENLNQILQKYLNPPAPDKAERENGGNILREGDKVMQIKNNYRIKWEDSTSQEQGEGIYNGDIGILTRISSRDKSFEVLFNDGKRVAYDFDQMDEITHAYAMTVHKSQGSEFPVVIMPIVGGPPLFLNRKLLYTAVTRAKKLLILIGNQYVFRQMIKSSESQNRQTALRDRIITYINHPMV